MKQTQGYWQQEGLTDEEQVKADDEYRRLVGKQNATNARVAMAKAVRVIKALRTDANRRES